MAPDPAFAFVGSPCCPAPDFVCVFWTMITFDTLLLCHFIYARACSAYDQFLNRSRLLTDKLLLPEFQQAHLKAVFRKLYGRYNNLVSQYDLPLSQMLSDMLRRFSHRFYYGLFRLPDQDWAHGGCDRSTGDAYSS